MKVPCWETKDVSLKSPKKESCWNAILTNKQKEQIEKGRKSFQTLVPHTAVTHSPSTLLTHSVHAHTRKEKEKEKERETEREREITDHPAVYHQPIPQQQHRTLSSGTTTTKDPEQHQRGTAASQQNSGPVHNHNHTGLSNRSS